MDEIDKDLTAKDMADALLKLHFENLEFARHHETMRSNVMGLLALLSGGLLSVLGVFSKFNKPDQLGQGRAATMAICFALIALGLFGMFLNGKLYERARRHSAFASGYLRALSDLFEKAGFQSFSSIQSDARNAHRGSFRFWRLVHLHWGWVAINLVFIGVGGGLLLASH